MVPEGEPAMCFFYSISVAGGLRSAIILVRVLASIGIDFLAADTFVVLE